MFLLASHPGSVGALYVLLNTISSNSFDTIANFLVHDHLQCRTVPAMPMPLPLHHPSWLDLAAVIVVKPLLDDSDLNDCPRRWH